MNVENLHDAIGQLPGDLIAETDKKRCRKTKVIPFRRYAAIAACLALICCWGLFLNQMLQPKGASEAIQQAAMEMPSRLTADSAAPAEEDSASNGIVQEASPESGQAAADFALRLFQAAHQEGENTLVSPLSVLSALGMTANGAQGETLEQMTQVLGLSADEANRYIGSFMDRQTDALKLANSIWFSDDSGLEVANRFLEINEGYYRADVFQTAMNSGALEAINQWVKEKTDGMIPEILDEVPENALLYLVNALAFDAEWERQYDQAHEAAFTTEDGTQQTVELMHSYESLYLEDELATGFMKPYKDNRYAFVVLLPNEGVRVSDYVNSLTGEALYTLLQNPQEVAVQTALPKFETTYDAELSQVLKDMGMEDAFDPLAADFSAMGTTDEGNLSIGRVLHKTCMSVGEEGTRAAAATAVEIRVAGAMQTNFVIANRPFVYMIVDTEEHLPIFMGTMMDPTK